jgi:hypothetical protein
MSVKHKTNVSGCKTPKKEKKIEQCTVELSCKTSTGKGCQSWNTIFIRAKYKHTFVSG